MTDRRSGMFDRREFLATPQCGGFSLADRPERRKDARLREELNARAATIMAELPAPPFPPKSGLKTSTVKHGVYAALRYGRKYDLA